MLSYNVQWNLPKRQQIWQELHAVTFRVVKYLVMLGYITCLSITLQMHKEVISPNLTSVNLWPKAKHEQCRSRQ